MVFRTVMLLLLQDSYFYYFIIFFSYTHSTRQPPLSTCFPLYQHCPSDDRHHGEPSQQPVLCSTKSPSISYCFPLSMGLSSASYYLLLPPVELYCTVLFHARFCALLQTLESALLVPELCHITQLQREGHWILYPTSFLPVDCEWFYLLFLLNSIVFEDMLQIFI